MTNFPLDLTRSDTRDLLQAMESGAVTSVDLVREYMGESGVPIEPKLT